MAAGCTTCGGGNSGQRIETQINMSDVNENMTMKQWILSLGWYYIGKCGCADNKDMYLNNDISGFKIEISPLSDRFEVWRMFSPIDGKRIGVGGIMNYKDVYNLHVLIEAQKYKI
jgi:hypothetical protein